MADLPGDPNRTPGNTFQFPTSNHNGPWSTNVPQQAQQPAPQPAPSPSQVTTTQQGTPGQYQSGYPPSQQPPLYPHAMYAPQQQFLHPYVHPAGPSTAYPWPHMAPPFAPPHPPPYALQNGQQFGMPVGFNTSPTYPITPTPGYNPQTSAYNTQASAYNSSVPSAARGVSDFGTPFTGALAGPMQPNSTSGNTAPNPQWEPRPDTSGRVHGITQAQCYVPRRQDPNSYYNETDDLWRGYAPSTSPEDNHAIRIGDQYFWNNMGTKGPLPPNWKHFNSNRPIGCEYCGRNKCPGREIWEQCTNGCFRWQSASWREGRFRKATNNQNWLNKPKSRTLTQKLSDSRKRTRELEETVEQERKKARTQSAFALFQGVPGIFPQLSTSGSSFSGAFSQSNPRYPSAASVETANADHSVSFSDIRSEPSGRSKPQTPVQGHSVGVTTSHDPEIKHDHDDDDADGVNIKRESSSDRSVKHEDDEEDTGGVNIKRESSGD
ncbi:hypothetical protein LTS18_009837 [Coniosporium uncinatum]|uniref:Uncharacterized protein n=1 Tax=Coniosporium uncinatum TaxID=93489 RepID=A0ACC3DZ00_9PEZI|nr:hypothetical protein LTS18_009837 [Coniosporium uncinatum]